MVFQRTRNIPKDDKRAPHTMISTYNSTDMTEILSLLWVVVLVFGRYSMSANGKYVFQFVYIFLRIYFKLKILMNAMEKKYKPFDYTMRKE